MESKEQQVAASNADPITQLAKHRGGFSFTLAKRYISYLLVASSTRSWLIDWMVDGVIVMLC
jgi:hypothetical protein